MIRLEVLNENIDLSDFISQSLNGTIFQNPRFLNYHPENRFPQEQFQIQNFQFFKKNKLVAFLPGRVVTLESGEKVYKSPFASSYGGYVFYKKIKFSEIEEVISLTIAHLKVLGVSEMHLTPGLTCYGHEQGEKENFVEYNLMKEGADVETVELCMVHKVSNEELMQRVDSKIRTELKHCIKYNVSGEVEQGVSKSAYDLLESSQANFGKTPTHSFEDLQRICELFPDKIFTFKSYHDGNLIGGIIGFKIQEKVLNTFYIFDAPEHREYKPNHYNYHQVLTWAQNNGIEYVDFGPATFGYTPHYPLIFFKEKFDALPFLKKRYIIKL